MIFLNKSKIFRFILLVLTTLVLAIDNALALSEEKNKNLTNQEISLLFENDERLFTLSAWLEWVTMDYSLEIDDKYKSLSDFIDLREYLKNLPVSKEIYLKHKKAYKEFMRQDNLPPSSQNKKQIFISFFYYYSSPPEFIKKFPKTKINLHSDPKKNKFANETLQTFPSSKYISDFYKFADINKIWNNKYKKLQEDLINKFKRDTKQILSETLKYFRMKQTYPIVMEFNVLNRFISAGLTTFSKDEKKYYILINTQIPREEIEIYYKADLSAIRHEFSHVLFNKAVDENAFLISKSLKKISLSNLELKGLPIMDYVYLNHPSELLAYCIGDMDYVGSFKSNNVKDDNYKYWELYSFRENIFSRHFFEKLKEFKKSDISFDKFIPKLFISFDPDKEIYYWKKVDKFFKEEKIN